MIVRWSQLGAPTQPGKCRVPGGYVDVEERDIDAADDIGGDPRLEIEEVTTAAATAREFRILQFIPWED